MARFDIQDYDVDYRAALKLPSLRVAGGRLVFDVYKGTGRVCFRPSRKPSNYESTLKPWGMWLLAMNMAWNYSPYQVRETYEKAAKVLQYQTPRDVFSSVASGRLFIEIVDDAGNVYHPIWLKPYLNK